MGRLNPVPAKQPYKVVFRLFLKLPYFVFE
jgi:hypothetical protein